MRPPAIDYQKLRLNNITIPEYRHLFLLLGWVGYFILYLLTENLIPAENCYPVHCALDDMVPFCEWFIIPYVSWYFLIIGSLAYFLFYSVDSFRNMQTYIIITQIIAMTVYIVFPNRDIALLRMQREFDYIIRKLDDRFSETYLESNTN